MSVGRNTKPPSAHSTTARAKRGLGAAHMLEGTANTCADTAFAHDPTGAGPPTTARTRLCDTRSSRASCYRPRPLPHDRALTSQHSPSKRRGSSRPPLPPSGTDLPTPAARGFWQRHAGAPRPQPSAPPPALRRSAPPSRHNQRDARVSERKLRGQANQRGALS